MKRIIFVFLIVILFFLKFPSNALADSNFSTDYTVTYSVANNANTHVTLRGVLKNLTDKYYASSYNIQVGFTDLKNLSASDLEGSINPKITKNEKGSTIALTFNQNVVGLDKELNFNISFDTSQVAQNYNNVWDINIPGIASDNDFSSFNVNVNYPVFLGNPTYIKPVPLSGATQKSIGSLFFTKSDLGGSGISIAFGNFQVYDFNLKYNLENKNLFPISTEIALPPNTNYQEILLEKINPKPVNVRTDKDGNWLAKYILPSAKKLEIFVNGKAKVYLNPKTENLDPESAKNYLKSQQYWDSDNEKIKALAKNLKTPYAIYQYVVKNLKYDFSRVESNSPRLGSAKALDNLNSAVCLEFTDLFIALSRAAGIPAREINGYANTSNTNERPLSFIKDILHAWPEYYDFDKKTWIMVDPTWGNTTGGVDYFNVLDFDHITFVIKGLNSNYPVPAGGYKLSANQNTKDVDVFVGSEFLNDNPSLNAEIIFPDILLSGLPINGEIKILNPGKTLIQKQEIKVLTKILKPQSQSVLSQDIPPYGYQILTLSFDKTPILTNSKDTIKITVNNSAAYKDVMILPFFVNKLFALGGLLIASLIIIISLTAYLYRRISLFRQRE